MDVISYLLGKKKGGGGGNLQTKDVTIIENGTSSVQPDTGYTGLSKINITTNVSGGIEEYLDKEIPAGGSSLSGIARIIKKVPSDATIKNNDMGYCFARFQGTELPLLDTSNVTNMQNAFYSCSYLETIPVYNTSKVTNLTNAFNLSTKFSDQTLDNILQMCINATSYTGTKTLYEVGLRSMYYPVNKIQALPHYQDFISAGWTIGY